MEQQPAMIDPKSQERLFSTFGFGKSEFLARLSRFFEGWGLKGIKSIPAGVYAEDMSGKTGTRNPRRSTTALNPRHMTDMLPLPETVIDEVDMLRAINRQDKLLGLAEAVKVAATFDADLFTYIEDHVEPLRRFDDRETHYVTRRCTELYIRHINDKSDPLDYGHWGAKRIEEMSQHRVAHAEAVAMGMMLDAIYANKVHLLATEDCERLRHLLRELGFDLYCPELTLTDTDGHKLMLEGLNEVSLQYRGDKAVPLLRRIGAMVYCYPVDTVVMSQALSQMNRVPALPMTL
ncbi:hypothetical protein ACKC9G_14460 [Pokkaliibacter sp. CJK22405]|uniref:3-dehydroquinate synthase family protein n=1 Tax=Pokkaliibacter sp. CJK22405 TaxID=3384615 RepID=UPI003984BBA5